MNIRNKWKPIVLGLLIALSTIVIVNSMDQVSAATTRYVGGGGVPNYATITQALAASSSGDTIYVNAGQSYSENVIVNVDVTIEATGGMALITPQTQSPIFTVTVPGVTIKNFIIHGQNQSYVDGVYSTTTGGEEGQEVIVENCIIQYCVNGVQFGYPAWNTAWHKVTDCNIHENSDDGILIYAEEDTGYHQIELSSIHDNGNHGIEIIGDYNTVYGCNIFSNTNDGINIFGDTNAITGDDSGTDDTYIFMNGDDGIDIDGDLNSVIDDCFIHNNTDEGINLYDSDYALIDECEIVYNGGDGIKMENCDDADVTWSYFTWNSYCAIRMTNCDDPYIGQCDFGEGYTAIHFITCTGGSSGYDVDGCEFYDRSIAIKVEGSTSIKIYGGKINDCTYGIYAICDSSNNESTGTITGTTLSGNPTIYLRGYDDYNKTDFKYSSLSGSYTTDLDDYSLWHI